MRCTREVNRNVFRLILLKGGRISLNTEYWNKRATKFGHTGWSDIAIYAYDQSVRISLIKYLLRKYPPKNHHAFLDFGGGDGDFSVALYSQFSKIVLFDISEKVLNIAWHKFKKKHLEHKISLVCTYENLIQNDLKYDFILSMTVLQHIVNDDELDSVLKILNSKLADDGVIYIIDSISVKDTIANEYIHFRTGSSILKSLDHAGLQLIEVFNFYNPIDSPTENFKTYHNSAFCKIMSFLWRCFKKLNIDISDLYFRYTQKKIAPLSEYVSEYTEDSGTKIFILKKK